MIYRKTFSFVLLKLALNFVCVLFSFAMLGLIYTGVRNGWNYAPILILTALWAVITLTIYPLADRLGGYLVRAGHIAVITESVIKGTIPEKPVSFGVKTVRNRFPVTATYFVVHNLVQKAIRQISRLMWSIAGDISMLLNLSMLDSLFSAYMKIAIGSIVDCCLGYTYSHPKRGAFQCACDGVVLYAANWKHMTKSAAKALAIFIVGPAVIFLAGVFSVKTLSLWILPIVLFALYLATAVKNAVVDSYVVCRMVAEYNECTISSELSDEYYETLKTTSSKFRNLCRAAKDENTERRKKAKAEKP